MHVWLWVTHREVFLCTRCIAVWSFLPFHWQSWRMFSCESSWGLMLQLLLMPLKKTKKKNPSGAHLSADCNVCEAPRVCRMFHVALTFFLLFVLWQNHCWMMVRGDRPQSAVVRGHHSKHSVSSEGTECHYTQLMVCCYRTFTTTTFG